MKVQSLNSSTQVHFVASLDYADFNLANLVFLRKISISKRFPFIHDVIPLQSSSEKFQSPQVKKNSDLSNFSQRTFFNPSHVSRNRLINVEVVGI